MTAAASAAAAAAAAGASAFREHMLAQDADEEAAAAEVHGTGDGTGITVMAVDKAELTQAFRTLAAEGRHGPVETPAGEITHAAGWCAPAEVVEAERARQHAADDAAAALADEELPDALREERGLTYRELLIVLTEELRFANAQSLDAPVRVDLGDTVDGIESVMYDPDAGCVVLRPWLTRKVPREELPAPGLHDFLIQQPHDAGAAFKVIRARRGMKRSALLALTAVSPSNIGNIERGVHRPSVDLLVKIAHALRTGVEIRDARADKPDRADFTIAHPSQVGPVLRALRLRRAVTLDTVAAEAGLRVRMLRQYEGGVTMPNLVTLLRILVVLDGILALADLDRRGDAA